MPVMVKLALPELVICTGWLAVVKPTVCAPKAKLRGVSMRPALGTGMPVPARLTATPPFVPAGKLLALLWMPNVPVLSPVVLGLKMSVMVQVWLGAIGTVVLQVPPSVPTGRMLLPPVTVMVFKVSGASPLLVTVTVLAALLVLITCSPKANLSGFTVILGLRAAMPVPTKSTSAMALVGAGPVGVGAGTASCVMLNCPTILSGVLLTAVGVKTK